MKKDISLYPVSLFFILKKEREDNSWAMWDIRAI